ncbi:ParA family protein [Catenovulum sediminis]|uniref:AAA family ATPase n=1 Tax=Catenovulum sediminis TaxID=1740262 RepID=A0ABV1RFX2_9ALTE|nr:AAA family ATPase [Catenovulum sediminis]
MKTIACYSMKGGVGKTASAVNLAWSAAQAGYKTLLIDLDPQGASSFYFRVKSKKKSWEQAFFEAHKNLLKHIKSADYENLDVLPAHFSFRNFDLVLEENKDSEKSLYKVLKGFKKQYDLVILDCPPTISNLSQSIFVASDLILVPVIPTTLSERTLVQLYQYFTQRELPQEKITPYFSMVQKQKHLHAETMQRLFKEYPQFLPTHIPFSADVEKMGEHRMPLGEFASGKPVFTAYHDLWRNLRDKLFPAS